MEALILLTLVGIFWIISPRRWRKRFVTPLALTVLVCSVVFSPIGIAIANWGLTFSLPKDPGEPVDAIVVLGRGETLRNRRVEIVEQLWQSKRAPRVFASGMLDAEDIMDRLKESGLPEQALTGESCSQTTEENAKFTSGILYPQGVRKILLVTDPPHMLRSHWLFTTYGFTPVPALSQLPPSLSTLEQLQTLSREYIALADYALNGRLSQKSGNELSNPPEAILAKMVSWNCKLPRKT